MSKRHSHLYDFDQFRLDAERQRLLRAGEVVALPPKAVELLLLLVEHQGQVVEKEFLMTALWGDTIVEESNLTQNVYLLRKALGKTATGESFIETHSKRGYRFVPAVQRVAPEEDAFVVSKLTRAHLVIAQEEVEESDVLPTDSLPAAPASKALPAAPSRLNKPLVLGLVALVLVGAAWGVWRRLSRPGALAPSAEPKSVPLTGAAGQEDYPAFSPDGRQVAYVWDGGQEGPSDIYVKLIGAGDPLRLTNTPESEAEPAWSPDGRFIAFRRDRNSLYVIPAMGGTERKVCDLSVMRGTCWLADGKHIVAAGSVSELGKAGLHLIEVETGAIRFLTTPPTDFFDQHPVLSPDGQTIAFTRSVFQTTEEQIYLVPATGGTQTPLPFKKHYLEGIGWSANGKEILAAVRRQLWRVPISGGEPEVAIQLGPMISSPAVARSGNLLAYKEAIFKPSIWHLARPASAPDPSVTARLTRFISSNRDDHSPEISPDGRQIVFASTRSGNEEIWLCEADGSKPVQLTNYRRQAGSPHWSPDGRWIVFDAAVDEGRASDIYLISPTGGATRRLTHHTARDILPTWSHDGKTIYFTSNRSGTLQIWKLSVDGGDQEALQLTQTEGYEAWEAPDGQHVYYTLGRAKPGRWRVPVGGGAAEPVPELADAGWWRSWRIDKEGLWYIGQADAAPFPLRLFDFKTRQAKTIAFVEREPLRWNPGLDVSPDGRWILYAQPEYKQSSIMLVENFR
jgi:Tol biopolymer transport system component/DNA-binding winged helix-turn-helix (wHTH) protein